MKKLIADIRNCNVCEKHLSHGANPIVSIHPDSKIAIIGQAPGIKVHKSSIPWADKSGERLRDWLGIDNSTFYSPKQVAIIPMGFCYPGKGKSGDLPPRPECAPLWHELIFKLSPNIKFKLLIGSYAQAYYLKDLRKRTLTETVFAFEEYLPEYFVLPHPSPRNNIWLKKNPWFEKQLVPRLRTEMRNITAG